MRADDAAWLVMVSRVCSRHRTATSALATLLDTRHCREQSARVSSLRPHEHSRRLPCFFDPPRVHHDNMVGYVLDHADVVRDEQVRDAEFALQFAQQVQDMSPHRHVERRSRLVADDQLRLHRQRPGHGDALALPSRKFVREASKRFAPQADLFDQALDGTAAFSAAQFRSQRAHAFLVSGHLTAHLRRWWSADQRPASAMRQGSKAS